MIQRWAIRGMGTVGTTSSDAEQRQADVAAPQVRVFINYRHDDTQGEAQLLYDRLASRFGSETCSWTCAACNRG